MLTMNATVCLFCDSEYGDPLLPYYVDKVAALCHLVSKENLLNKKMCMRCKLNVDMIENALRLRDIMVGSLNMKLATLSSRVGAGDVASHTTQDAANLANHLPPPLPALRDSQTGSECVESTDAGKEDAVSTSTLVSSSGAVGSSPAFNASEALINSVNMFGAFTMPHLTNGSYSNGVTPAVSHRTHGRRIPKCPKCSISLKTRPYNDAMKHIHKCNGQGVRPGRASMTPRPSVFPCRLCHKRLATKEALDLHIIKCNGTNNNTRGRKPADNTCMICNQDQVYRHILKKHLRQTHGINAQRLDDSVLAALKTGSGTGSDVKEQVLSRIQQKLVADLYDVEKSDASETADTSAVENVPADSQTSQDDLHMGDDDEAEENKRPSLPQAEEDALSYSNGLLDNRSSLGNGVLSNGSLSNGSRSRKKMKPSKYVAEVHTCGTCSQQYEFYSQLKEHRCQNPDVEQDSTADAQEVLNKMEGVDACDDVVEEESGFSSGVAEEMVGEEGVANSF